MKKIFLMALAAVAILSSCSKQDGEPGPGDKTTTGKAYLSINLFGTTQMGTRAEPTTASGQDKVNDITIIYFSSTDDVVGNSGELDPATAFTYTAGTSSYRTSTPIEVPGTTAKVFVIVNNNIYDGAGNKTGKRFTIPADGTTWTAANLLKTYAGTDVNAFIADYVGQTKTIDGVDNFAMVNYGVRFTTGTTLNTDDNGLVGVKLGSTPAEATAEANAAPNKNTVYVDRMASKVEFTYTQKSGGATDEILATPTNASFFFQNWEMNATNRKMRLYAKHEKDYDAIYTGINSAYRVDENYLSTSYGTLNVWTGYVAEFAFLRNIGYAGAIATDGVTRVKDEVAYCPENTMAADAQLVGATTKIVIKGNYAPASDQAGTPFAKGASYFSYLGQYYTLAQIQAAYVNSAALGHDQGIAKDFDNFLIAAGLILVGDADTERETKVAALTAGSFDKETGIKARTSNAVRYFHNGVSYYDVLIRHDSNITTDMALGRYGTVRNNWYRLTLSKVSRPGTPWIPGGPEDPGTDPKTPDDQQVSYLDCTITINPWVQWTQGIEL